MTRFAMTCCALLLSLSAVADKRAPLPDNVAIVMADSIVVAEIIEILPRIRFNTAARIRVERSLKGTLKGEHAVELPEGQYKVGERVIVHLVRDGTGWKSIEDGAARHSASVEAARVADIAEAPAWSAPVQGGSMVLTVSEHDIASDDHLDAWVVYRNTTAEPKTLSYTEKPTSAHTYWSLTAARSGMPVRALSHPHVSAADREAYFPIHGHQFEAVVPPGDTFALPLQRINSAQPGWGYKQRQGFEYLPMTAPGTYTIRATERGFAGRPALTSAPVTVRVR